MTLETFILLVRTPAHREGACYKIYVAAQSPSTATVHNPPPFGVLPMLAWFSLQDDTGEQERWEESSASSPFGVACPSVSM